jgi:hypothetical protein
MVISPPALGPLPERLFLSRTLIASTSHWLGRDRSIAAGPGKQLQRGLVVGGLLVGPANNPSLRQSAARNCVDHHALAINHAGSTGVGSAAAANDYEQRSGRRQRDEERAMTPKNWLIAAASALTLGLSAVSAQAAPVSGAASDIRNASSETGAVERIDYRYGYRRHHHYYDYGHRHYRHYYYGRGHRHDYDRRHHHRRYW